ncbi:MAG TPA: PadR family transcriptional regulator [Actinomycetota bacterium]|nr:PadR family transcriptional regulator [Actinomycetota bacterium]
MRDFTEERAHGHERWAHERYRHEARHHGGHHGRYRFGRGFGPWGRGEFPGPFYGRGARAGRGDVRAAILALLAERPMHGYQVIQELTERTRGVWRPSPGSVYPTLQMLEDEGLVTSSEADGRRVFELTDAGRQEVARRGGEAPWAMAADASPVVALWEVGRGVAMASMQVAQTGDEQQVARAIEILREARKSLYRLLADDESTSDDHTEA